MKKHLQTHCPFHFPVSIFKQQITSFFILSYILCDTDKGHKILQGNQRHRKRKYSEESKRKTNSRKKNAKWDIEV